MRVSLFGGVRIADADGEDVDIGSMKNRAVFAVLALSAGQAVPVGRLVECVWGAHPPEKADKTLQSYVSLLRTALEPHSVSIERIGVAYVMHLDEAAVDVLRFERQIRRNKAQTALAEWTGLPLAGLDAPGLEPVVAGLLERRQTAMHVYLTACIDDGRAHDAIGPLAELTADDPSRETWWELSMTALYRVGRQADALAAYAAARRHLVNELGVEPGPRLRSLHTQILRQESAVEPLRIELTHESTTSDRLPSGDTGSNPTNLPAARSELIGRHDAVRHVREALAEHRLVTITAGGGTGKTRLALAIGEEELPDRADGVWFTDLTAITDGDQVPAAVAGAIGLVLAGGDVTEQVIEYLSDLDALVILDNCEHLVQRCAAFAERLLTTPGRTRLLATSREVLDIDGERPVKLSPLATTGDASPATRLFIVRARQVNSSFEPGLGDVAAITELSQRLDGLPLAIELAAARSNVLTPRELLAGIGDRFELLGTGRRRRTGPTLEETLDWSYALLEHDEQVLFRSLGVLASSFDLDAVAAISVHDWSTAIELLESLIAKSLVVREPCDGPSRFRLLETTAEYAANHLRQSGDLDRLRDRHLDHFVAMCAPLHVGFLTNGKGHALIPDIANLRAAFHWAAERERWQEAGTICFGSAAAMRSNADEVRTLVDACRPVIESIDAQLAFRLRYVRWDMCMQLDDWSAARAMIPEFEESSDVLHRAMGGLARGFVQMTQSPSTSLATLVDATTLAVTLPETVEKDQILGSLHVLQGWAEVALGRPHVALRHFEIARSALSAPNSTPDLLTLCLQSTIITLVIVGDARSALDLLPLLEGHHHVYVSGECQAIVHLALGDLDQALPIIRRHASEGVTGRLSRQANDSLLLLALLAHTEGADRIARELLLQAGPCRSPATIACSLHLADQLNIRSEFDDARREASTHAHASGQRALAHLGAEIDRRRL